MNKIKTILSMATIAVATFSANAITVTLNVDKADAVKVTCNGNSQTLSEGANTLDFQEYDYIQVEGISPYVIESVTNASGTPESVYYGMWSKTIFQTDEGAAYSITVKNMDEARTGSCTVTVDDASLVKAQLSGTYSPVTFQNGTNTLKFDPQAETTLMLSCTNSGKSLYSVTLDGVALTSQYGQFEVPLSEGCVIDIVATVPDKDITVTISYSDGGMGAITGVMVDGAAYEAFDGTTVNMKAGQSLSLTPNYDYNIVGLSINGEPTGYTGGYSYTISSVMDDTEIYVDAHPYGTIKVKVNVSDPAHLKLYRGYSYQNDLITLTSTENEVELSENNPVMSWAAAEGCYIESVTVDGIPTSNDYVQATDNMVINFVTNEITMDKQTVVWIDDRAAVDTYFSFQTQTRENLGDNFTSGYNLVDFYNGYNPFNLSWYSNTPTVGKIYINGELQSPMYEGSSTYEFTLADRDVVKMFFGKEPQECDVEFTVNPGTVASVTRDLIVEVPDYQEGFSCFAGTNVTVSNPDKALEVTVNGTTVEAAEGTHSYSFTVNDASTNVVVKEEGSGIGSIESETVNSPVYNLQGIKVGDNTGALPAGIYIVNGKKIIVK